MSSVLCQPHLGPSRWARRWAFMANRRSFPAHFNVIRRRDTPTCSPSGRGSPNWYSNRCPGIDAFGNGCDFGCRRALPGPPITFSCGVGVAPQQRAGHLRRSYIGAKKPRKTLNREGFDSPLLAWVGHQVSRFFPPCRPWSTLWALIPIWQ